MTWQTALQQVLETIYSPLQQQNIAWAVGGSVATTLQGCRLSPGDLEIVVPAPETVAYIADLLAGFAAPDCTVESPAVGPWRSTAQVPVYIGSYWGLNWHFGCWEVAGFEVEVAHVVAPGGHSGFRGTDGVWDTDPRIWSHIRAVSFAGYDVPVVPLEIQLETNLLRWQESGDDRFEFRVKEISRVFKTQSYDRTLVAWSLRTEHQQLIEKLLGKSDA